MIQVTILLCEPNKELIHLDRVNLKPKLTWEQIYRINPKHRFELKLGQSNVHQHQYQWLGFLIVV